jgi:hypothetical protein
VRYIKVITNSGGNHGHKIKDILSGTVIAGLLNFKQVYHHAPMVDFYQMHMDQKKIDPKRTILIRSQSWSGMPINDVIPLFKAIPDEYLVILDKSTRLFPWQLCEIDKYNILMNIINMLSNRFDKYNKFKSPLTKSRINVGIHAVFFDYGLKSRFHYNRRYRFPVSYYRAIMDQIRLKIQNPMFHIFIEKRDLKIASELKSGDVKIWSGSNRGEKQNCSAQRAFVGLVKSDIMVTCNSSFSVTSTYFRGGRPTIYHPHEHLKNLPENNNFYATNLDGLFDVDRLAVNLQTI